MYVTAGASLIAKAWRFVLKVESWNGDISVDTCEGSCQ